MPSLLVFGKKNRKSGFFDGLREASEAGLTMSQQEIRRVLSNPHVKVGVLSDVHANLQALERVFEDAEERGVNVFLNAGDSVGYGPYPSEVVELLCEKNVLSVLGNYDLEVLEGNTDAKGEKKLAWKFARKELTDSGTSYLRSLPQELRLEVAGKRLLVTHGSPESIDEHIYSDTPAMHLQTLADCAKADLVLVGHSHEQFSKQAKGVWFVNPGSVGRPGDGNPQTSYAVVTFEPLKVELVRLDYDVASAADALRRKGLPESFAQMLLQGVGLDTVTEQDQVKQDLMVEGCRGTVAAVKGFSNKCWPDTAHYMQVTKLALRFFDGLGKLHGLGKRERCWLECAAILHDIGLSQQGSAHHKKSATLILNSKQLPFTSEERRIIACIARYHRKGLPKQKHHNLAPLNRKTIHKIEVLASFLRVADGLDYTHEATVEHVRFRVEEKKVTVEYISGAKSMLEEQAFNKKKDLFEKVFAKKLVLLWKQP